MDSQKMTDEVIKPTLIPFYRSIKRRYPRHRFIVMQDGAPVHQRFALAELKKKKIPLLPWPPQSPDLNPIENLWRILKERVKKRSKRPKSIAELQDILKDEWKRLTVEDFNGLIECMQKQVTECITNKGGATHY